MANNQRDPKRELFWREVLGRQAWSGLNVRKFCRRETLKENSFYAWRRTIGQRDDEVNPAEPSSPFVPAVVTDTPSRNASIVLELGKGRVLKITRVNFRSAAGGVGDGAGSQQGIMIAANLENVQV